MPVTRSAALASIATALLLAALKGWAAWRTGSTAMLGSLADTALDDLMRGELMMRTEPVLSAALRRKLRL